MGITLRQLEIFEKVAVNEHITKASEDLYISQSAISMAIAELEKETGGKLFERRGRRLLLNERGRNLLPKVTEILSMADNITRMMKDSAADPIGILHVGASTTIGNYLLPTVIGRFKKIFPRAEALLSVGNTRQIEEGVQSGKLDLGLIEGPSHLVSLRCLPWRRDELVVIASPDNPWAKKKKASAKMLAEASWVVREKDSGTREVFEAAMAEKVTGFKISLELGHTEAIKKAVEANLGVGCLSRLTVARELKHHWLVEIVTPLNLNRTLTVIMHKDKYKTRLFNSFMELLENYRDDY